MNKNTYRTILFTKLNSKWIEDFNIRVEALKLIEEKVGNNFKCIGTGKDSEQSSISRGAKISNKQMGLHETEKLLQRRHHWDQLADFYQPHI